MRRAARAAVYALIALAVIPTLLIGLTAALALLLYAILEEFLESAWGGARLGSSTQAPRRGARG